jgi:ribonuclease P protein component
VSHLLANQSLKKAKDFQKVFSDPQRFVTKHFVFLYQKNKLSENRLGLMISKKKVKLSVKRNLMKRWLKVCFQKDPPSVAGIDCIVIARHHVDELFVSGFKQVVDQWLQFKKKLAKQS